MNQSDQINDLAAALAAAQGAMDHAQKDRTNPAFKSRYADLASVVDACRPALSANGIAVLQPARVLMSERGATVEVDTRLVHKSGQWVAETLAASVADTKAQSVGSAITYLRRYGLSAMVGVAPDDDDGQAATRPAPAREDPRPAPQPAPPAPPAKLSEAQKTGIARVTSIGGAIRRDYPGRVAEALKLVAEHGPLDQLGEADLGALISGLEAIYADATAKEAA